MKSPDLSGAWWVRFVVAVFALGFGNTLLGQVISQTHVDAFDGHPRLIVISDIGNEPDDQMSLIRLLLYSNELDIEALIAATSTWQKSVTHAETMHEYALAPAASGEDWVYMGPVYTRRGRTETASGRITMRSATYQPVEYTPAITGGPLLEKFSW